MPGFVGADCEDGGYGTQAWQSHCRVGIASSPRQSGTPRNDSVEENANYDVLRVIIELAQRVCFVLEIVQDRDEMVQSVRTKAEKGSEP